MNIINSSEGTEVKHSIFEADGPRLAMNWPRGKVLRYLRAGAGQKMQIRTFVAERYEERFFDPIRCLISSGTQGFGFAVMSLCCLMIETIQCYRLGWPASSAYELTKLTSLRNDVVSIVPQTYRLVGPFPRSTFNSETVFKSFFETPEHGSHFRELIGKGKEFYDSVRCGLLHQAQTKQGWRIRMSGNCYQECSWGISINRDQFAESLHSCFQDFLKELEDTEWNQPLWQSVWKKLWWLAITS